ncbi:hypothetical protein CA830_31785 [Burkholderia multivorans]|nr:hypothetical protein CA830_31785 [Burkholderia multivorans]
MSRRPRHTAAFMLRAELDAAVLMLSSPWVCLSSCRDARHRGALSDRATHRMQERGQRVVGGVRARARQAMAAHHRAEPRP